MKLKKPLRKPKKPIRKQNNDWFSSFLSTNCHYQFICLARNVAFAVKRMGKNKPMVIMPNGQKIVDFLPDLQADTIDLKKCREIWPLFPTFGRRKTTYYPSFEAIDAVAKRTLSFIWYSRGLWMAFWFQMGSCFASSCTIKRSYHLDVGCGSGYHMWRMVGEGAKMVVGIDPTELFLANLKRFENY